MPSGSRSDHMVPTVPSQAAVTMRTVFARMLILVKQNVFMMYYDALEICLQ